MFGFQDLVWWLGILAENSHAWPYEQLYRENSCRYNSRFRQSHPSHVPAILVKCESASAWVQLPIAQPLDQNQGVFSVHARAWITR